MDPVAEDPAETEARRNAEAEDPAAHARTWLLQVPSGTLCTTTARRGLEGYPFGSVVPFALDPSGLPVILIAGIATHTANLVREPRASLFVQEPGLEGDPQKGWRITVMGRWEEVAADAPELGELHARYVERVPWAEGYLQTHDFSYWRMTSCDAVRYIGGFGKIAWLPGDAILRDPLGEGMGAAAPGAVDHMNEDHQDAMIAMCKGRYGFEPEGARMVSLERTGFFVRTIGPERICWFPFGREITAAELRPAVIEVLRRARAHGA